MVFSGLYPADTDDYDHLRQALEKLKLNDASLEFIPETSEALGFGFRCGFLGLLHLEIIQERLEREFNLDLVTTTPNVIYKIINKSGRTIKVDTPSKMPESGEIQEIFEPIVKAEILTPKIHWRNNEFMPEKRGYTSIQIIYLLKKLNYIMSYH